MRKLTFENIRGESVTFFLRPFLITSLTGIGEVDVDIQSQSAPYQDGDTHIDTLLEPRFIEMEGVITNSDLKRIREYRRAISKVCNPKLGLGTITLELDGDIKQIEAVMDGGVTFPERGQDVWQKFLINWKCPDPYWKDETETKQSLIAYRNGFSYPFSYPKSYGIEGQSVVAVNNGDEDTPIEVEFYGPSLNPVIHNTTTGEFIKVYRKLEAGERLTLNTAFNKKRVEITRTDRTVQNAYGYVDWFESDFIKLIPGNNVLKYTADSGTEQAVVNISYRNLYVGM